MKITTDHIEKMEAHATRMLRLAQEMLENCRMARAVQEGVSTPSLKQKHLNEIAADAVAKRNQRLSKKKK